MLTATGAVQGECEGFCESMSVTAETAVHTATAAVQGECEGCVRVCG